VRTTLFHIPAEAFHIPIFGFGWLLLVLIAIAIATSMWLLRRPGGSRELPGYLMLFAVIAFVDIVILPSLVERTPNGKLIGLPIRGYGVMMMLATVAGVGLAAFRAWQVGLDPEIIYSLAFVMFLSGIIGARLFFVVEYWNQDFSPAQTGSILATLQNIINVPKGGLVVYGSVLFGVPAGIWFCRRRGLPTLAIGDIIAPSMVVGLALGRIGCFLNGCCYGGVCLTSDLAVTFPRESPPYLQHEAFGWHSGVWLQDKGGRIIAAYVAPQGPATDAGLKPGDEIVSINGAKAASLPDAQKKLAAASASIEIETGDGRVLRWLSSAGPPRSVPVHAAQLYAAIDAGLLALVLWFLFPYRRRDGEVFAVLLMIHPMSRFLLEFIRSDEPKYPLTVSQWISLLLIAAGVALLIYVEQQPRGSALPTAAA
jgi:phosphatidylglycerol---prolipoprotein diacylglyceryl transferase